MKRISALIAIALMAITASAAPLSPEQALSAARSELPQSTGRMKMAAAPMSLAYTMKSAKQTATLYVFTPGGDSSTGFMVVSADDAVPALLGYSDEGTFDAENIPENVAYWLEQYSLYIEQMTGTDAQKVRRTAPRYAEHTSISPICKTNWNQSEPYNNQCPIVNGSRSVTGCVATALAQILKVHQWPDKGVGTHSYSFKVDGTTYNASFNFGNTTFDWANMSNKYTSTSTTKQKNAVSTLMSAIGVAADMSYSPNGSGANAYRAGAGLIEYLKYDRGMKYMQRDWFSADDWDNMIYAELAAGRPVYYDGNDGSVGHAFVCDGYSSSQYYHINWGWGGAYDGYFLLSNLYPEGQGIGGGSGDEGFNYGQGAMLGLMPAKSGSQYYPVLAFAAELTTNKTTYSRANNETIIIKGAGQYGGFYNYSLCALTDLHLGVELVNGDKVEYAYYGSAESLDQLYGFGELDIHSADLPVGNWKMYPAFQCFDDDTWYHIYAPVASGSPSFFNIEVSDDRVTVTPGYEFSGDDVVANLKSWTPINTVDKDIFASHTYKFNFEINAPIAFDDDIYCVIFDNDYKLVTYAGPQSVKLTQGSFTTKEFEITIPKDVDEGKYNISLATRNSDGNLVIMDEVSQITILGAQPVCTFIGWRETNGHDEELYPGHTYDFKFSITSPTTTTTDYYCVIYKDYVVTDYVGPKSVALKDDSSVDVTYTITIPQDAAIGEHKIGLATLSNNNLSVIAYPANINIVQEYLILECNLLKVVSGDTESTENYILHQNVNSTLTFNIETSMPWAHDVICRLVKKNTITGKYTTYVESEPQPVDLLTYTPAVFDWNLYVDDSVPTGSNYYIGLCYLDGTTSKYLQVFRTELQGPCGIENVAVDNAAPAIYYNLNGTEVENPGPGIYIKVKGSKREKVIIK